MWTRDEKLLMGRLMYESMEIANKDVPGIKVDMKLELGLATIKNPDGEHLHCMFTGNCMNNYQWKPIFTDEDYEIAKEARQMIVDRYNLKATLK